MKKAQLHKEAILRWFILGEKLTNPVDPVWNTGKHCVEEL